MNHSYAALASRKSTSISTHVMLGRIPRACLTQKNCALTNPASLLIQPKLKIGAPNDKYEQEADRVADQVMRMPTGGTVQTDSAPPRIQRFCPECEEELQQKHAAGYPQVTSSVQLIQRQEIADEEEEEELLQDGGNTKEATPIQEPEEEFPLLESVDTRDADELGKDEEKFIQPKRNSNNSPQMTAGITNNIHSLNGRGQPLPASERAFFEPRFGMDFSNVRIHTDQTAARTAQSINARAFTLGREVVFGDGQYSPGTQTGRSLLAHELTHVVQQSGDRDNSKQRVSLKTDLQINRLDTHKIQRKTIDDDYNKCINTSGSRLSRCQARGAALCAVFGARFGGKPTAQAGSGGICFIAYNLACQKTNRNDLSFCKRKRSCLKKGINQRKVPQQCEGSFMGWFKGGSGDPWPGFSRYSDWYDDWGKKPSNWPPKRRIRSLGYYWQQIDKHRRGRGGGYY